MARLQVLPLPTPDGADPRFALIFDEVDVERLELSTFADEAARELVRVELEAPAAVLAAQVGAVAVAIFAERIELVLP